VRDAKYDYSRLTMRTCQTFIELQTQFLHLAGEAQIPAESLRLDLFDKLTTQLQEKLAAQLRTLDTYEELSASCLSLDAELRRIAARSERRKLLRNKPSPLAVSAPLGIGPSTLDITTRTRNASVAPRNTSITPRNQELRQTTPAAPNAMVTCYNCSKPGHYAPDCPEPRKTDLKEIEEDIFEFDDDEESGKGEP